VESQNFAQIIPQKGRRPKISLFKGLSLLLKLISDKNSTMGDQYYPIFGRKKVKICDNLG
jgi:hypothetical protein